MKFTPIDGSVSVAISCVLFVSGNDFGGRDKVRLHGVSVMVVP